MPDGINERMHDGRCKNAVRLAPCSPIKNSSDSREQGIAPIRKYAIVGDVCEAKNGGRGEPPERLI